MRVVDMVRLEALTRLKSTTQVGDRKSDKAAQRLVV